MNFLRVVAFKMISNGEFSVTSVPWAAAALGMIRICGVVSKLPSVIINRKFDDT